MSRRGLVRASLDPVLAPVWLMCLVAGVQLWLASAYHLSPWKGGGFGMFSTTDDPGARFIQCTGETVEGERVVIRAPFSAFAPGTVLSSATARRLRTFPDQATLRRVGEALLDVEFVPIDEPGLWRQERFIAQNPGVEALLPSPVHRPQMEIRPCNPLASGHAESRRCRLRRVALHVWRVTFEAGDDTISVHSLVGPVELESGT